MILTPVDAIAYRVHQPKWSIAPASGADAGTHGGRANRPGVNALYLSLALETALAEYQQLDALPTPGLMVSYRLRIDAIVDFRGGYTGDWEALWQASGSVHTCRKSATARSPKRADKAYATSCAPA